MNYFYQLEMVIEPQLVINITIWELKLHFYVVCTSDKIQDIVKNKRGSMTPFLLLDNHFLIFHGEGVGSTFFYCVR